MGNAAESASGRLGRARMAIGTIRDASLLDATENRLEGACNATQNKVLVRAVVWAVLAAQTNPIVCPIA